MKEDYSKKLADLKLKDPKQIPVVQRIDDMKIWPSVSLGNIFEYILNLRTCNTEYVGRYRDQKACSYFNRGFADERSTHQTKKDYFLYCNVRASMSNH